MYGVGIGPAGIGAAPCCRLRHGFVNGRRLTKEAHVPFTKPQAAKTGKAESPFVRLKNYGLQSVFINRNAWIYRAICG